MKSINVVTALLVVVGAVNWGLIAIARFDLVAAIFGMQFGEVSGLSAIIYGLVGISGLYQAFALVATPRRPALASATAIGAVVLGLGAATLSAQQKDIVDTAVANGSFKTLAAALQAAGLVDTLKGAGPFTVFAPTDAAFAKLPAGTVETLLKPENKDQLRRVLTYHVVAGKVDAAAVTKMSSGKAVSGDSFNVSSKGGKVMINNANVVTADVAASNGVIHVIDTVILPPEK